MAKTKKPPVPGSTGDPVSASVARQVGATARRLRGSLGLTLGEVAKRSNIRSVSSGVSALSSASESSRMLTVRASGQPEANAA